MKKFHAINYYLGGDDYKCIFIVKTLKKDCRRFQIVKILSSNFSNDWLPSTSFKKGLTKKYIHYMDYVMDSCSSDSFKECYERAMLEIL